MPAWMSGDGAWIAFGVTAVTLVMAVAMHRVIVRGLKSPPPPDTEE